MVDNTATAKGHLCIGLWECQWEKLPMEQVGADGVSPASGRLITNDKMSLFAEEVVNIPRGLQECLRVAAGRGANRCAVDDQFQSKPFPVGPAANEKCQERPLNGEL